MVNIATIVKNVDNSGAKVSKCVNISRLNRVRGAEVGNLVRVLIKVKVPKRHIKKKSKIIVKGQIYTAIVVQQNGPMKRRGNSVVKGSFNSVILLNEYLVPYATRVFGPICKEVRNRTKYKKIIAMAKRVF
jgi:large subunit ribosomal protein L14